MEYEHHYETPRQDNYHKLQLLAEVFRIAYFGEDVVSGYDGYGQQGYAFGPAGDVAATFKQGMQFDRDGDLYRKGNRAHVASLQLGDDVYEFYAVHGHYTGHEAYPLDRAVAGDFDKARRLSEEPEIDIDELYDIEISHANEVDSNEIQFLAKLLSEQYFVTEKPPLQD